MSAVSTNPLLLLIDVQQGFDDPVWGERNNPDAESNIARLLAAWRGEKLPVCHVQHLSRLASSPLHPSHPGHVFKPEALPLPLEQVFSKTVNSAFIGTDLERHLRNLDIRTIYVAGLTTPHCVSTSVRMGANLGFEMHVLEDATAAFSAIGPDGAPIDAQAMHYHALAALHGEFATIANTQAVLAHMSGH